MRLDILGQMFLSCLVFYLVYGGVTQNASNVGFVITVAGKLARPPMLVAHIS